MIKKITIEIIPHIDQRYNTVGDWQFTHDQDEEPTGLNIKVSDIGDGDKANMLIALHEFAEAVMCESSGVSEEQVDKFDMNWKPRRVHWSSDTLLSEPGEDHAAPYYRQHQIATAIERLVAAQLWVEWSRYEFLIDRLCRENTEYFERLNEAQKTTAELRRMEEDDDIPF